MICVARCQSYGLNQLYIFSIEGEVNSVVWDASLTLAAYLLQLNKNKPDLLKDKTVIELGSGIGLCGMVAATLGADALLTDLEAALKLLKHNVEENKKKFPAWKIQVQEFLWSKETAEELCKDRKFDYILLADCIYYKDSIEPLIDALRVLVKDGTTVIFTQELRESRIQINLFKQFLSMAKDFLIIKEVPISEQHPDYHSEEIMIFSCTKK